MELVHCLGKILWLEESSFDNSISCGMEDGKIVGFAFVVFVPIEGSKVTVGM